MRRTAAILARQLMNRFLSRHSTMFMPHILRRLQRKFIPTACEKADAKWLADGGDRELRFNYDLNSNSLVFDLGGYEGQWTSDLFSRYQCSIMVFEPVSRFVRMIQKRFRCNAKIKVYPYGLGGSSRKEVIGICADGSSIFRSASEREEIEIVDVAEWLKAENIKHIDLMKINIEGGEYELLERLIGTRLVQIIDNIQVQFHEMGRDSAARMERIQKSLMETYQPTYQYRFVWENWKKR